MSISMCKQCWTTNGVLREGKIVSTRMNPDYFIVRYDDGNDVPVTPAYVHHSLEQARDACLDNVEYWKSEASALQEKINQD